MLLTVSRCQLGFNSVHSFVDYRSCCNIIDKIIINGMLLYDLIELNIDNFIFIIIFYDGTSKSGSKLGRTLLSKKFVENVSFSLRNTTIGWLLLTSIFVVLFNHLKFVVFPREPNISII